MLLFGRFLKFFKAKYYLLQCHKKYKEFKVEPLLTGVETHLRHCLKYSFNDIFLREYPKSRALLLFVVTRNNNASVWRCIYGR